MKHVLLFDTSIGSDNVGDQIIMDYCIRQLLSIFNDEMLFYDRAPTHLEIGRTTFAMNRKAALRFICGTNILKTSVLHNKIWKISFFDVLKLHDICLMGVGWNNYTKFPMDIYTKWMYHSLFSRKMLHSVRDSFTEKKLHKIGIRNAINTACPTMWNLTSEHCSLIPKMKAKDVVTALTYYNQDREKDKLMLEILQRNYEKIYLWLQQPDDYDYYISLQSHVPVEFIKPVLSEYDQFLMTHDVDFIGSRLHGGIRALNYKKRTLIIAIDNRAMEIHNDTNLPVINRDDMENIDIWINKSQNTEIRLPLTNILEWKESIKCRCL